MPNPHTAEHPQQYRPANDRRIVEIGRGDLPLHCPMPGTALWASHPRVYLPIEDAPDGRVVCPYCGTEFHLQS